MDSTKENVNVNPREKANIFSVLFFTYTLGLFRKGYSKTLETVDLFRPLPKDKSSSLGDRLERNWNAHLADIKLTNKKPSLIKVLFKTFWAEVSNLALLMILLDVVIRIIQPIMLGYLLDYYTVGSLTTRNEALCYAGAVAGLDLICAILMNQMMMNSYHYGMKLRIACCTLVYRKGLRLSSTALGETASGKVVNLLSNDVSRFDVFMLMLHYLWGAPLMCVIVMVILYSEVKFAGIIGMIPLFLIVPIQSYFGKLSAVYRKQTAQRTDERIRLTDEVVSGIQVIKMYAWEIPFNKVVTWARKMEVKVLTKASYLRGIFMAFKLFTSRIALFCTILTMALNNQTVSANRVFVFTLFFHVLTQAIAGMFVRGIAEVAEVLISIERIQKFLMNEEFSKSITHQNGTDIQKSNEDTAIIFKNVMAKWAKNSDEIALSDINLKITTGKLHGIIGPVGSGKSSMLQSILGEIYITQGTLNVNGTVSYASQEPWLFNATVRHNILFGLPYERRRYKEVVEVCALLKDFEQLPDGDGTIIGDRGGSLSGGQKARVNLARAVYRDADVYLLDDPLSAVDIHVGRHLYSKCINGYLANKTRILVTHQIYLLKDADHIVILNDGVIEAQGNFHEIATSNNEYIKGQLTEPEEDEEDVGDEEFDEVEEIENILENGRLSTRVSFSAESGRESSCLKSDSITRDDLTEEDVQKLMGDSKIMKRSVSKISRKSMDSRKSVETIRAEPVIMQEESSLGKVKGNLFWKYHLAGGNLFCCTLVLILYLLTQTFASSVDYFLSVWTNIEESKSDPDLKKNLPSWSRETCIYIYVGLITCVFVVTLVRSFSFYKLAMRASQKLHDNLFKNVLYASMRFFDTTPGGRILNRFSKDMGSIDELLPKAILDAGQIVLQLAGSLVLVSVVNPYLLVLVIILCIIFWFLRKVFLKSSTNIKRLEGIMKGPVFTHMNATLQGLPTIRACGAQAILKEEFDRLQDYHTSTWFMYLIASSAFGFICDFLSSLFTGIVTFSFLLFTGTSKAGEVGLAITQAATLTGIIQWGMRQSAEIVNQLISVERILEYESLPREDEPEVPEETPLDWPNRGLIEFKDMGLKYDESEPLVLKNLNLTIQPKEKVGIVGRTGAGKSSLISALFRLANIHGEIEIDKINTGHIRLHDLRSRISIIPQDPVLFSGTLRYNLDPFEEYQDADLYKAINEVELKDPQNIINRLDYKVMDRGVNYSVGQRQLICLARAIVRNNKILMLDEATANVDPQTDGLIQKTIRSKFSDCTVLTVAHRLNTIMDSDKVMVMERGSVIEFDHPHVLLQNKEGKFYSMVIETESSVAEHLKHIAKETYYHNHKHKHNEHTLDQTQL